MTHHDLVYLLGRVVLGFVLVMVGVAFHQGFRKR
jgi:hypothetical protein